ncbi:MAG: hypothetical protein AB2L21_02490 [Anaerolineaceae bacterium]
MNEVKTGFKVIGAAIKLWWDDWSNQELVSLAAILLSLTIVLFPAATFGIYQESLDLTHGIRTGIAGFWQGFKKNFGKSLLWGLLNILVAAGIGFCIWFYTNSKFSFAPLLVIFLILLAVFWFLWQYFSVTCFFLQTEKSLKLAWKNGLALMLTQPVLCLVSGLLAAILTVLSFRYYIPLLIAIPTLLALLGLMTVQQTLLPEAGKEEISPAN